MIRGILIVGWSLVLSALLLLTLFLNFPDFTRFVLKEKAPYLAHRSRFLPDKDLGFRHRRENFNLDTNHFQGDLWMDGYGLSNEGIEYHATYEGGFRKNSSRSCDIAVVGDSFMEIGETDRLTLTEMMAESGKLGVCNFGMGGYGPVQYLEVFRRHVLPRTDVKTLIVEFYSGNDIADISNADRLKEMAVKWSFVDEYYAAMHDVLNVIQGSIQSWLSSEKRNPGEYLDTLAKVPTESGEKLLAIRYFNPKMTPEHLARDPDWRVLADVLTAVKREARQKRLRLFLLYIPTSSEVYADIATAKEGTLLSERLKTQSKYGDNLHTAFLTLANQLELPVIDLLPAFRNERGRGDLLYFQFDSHWNRRGREVAAREINRILAQPNQSENES